VPQVRGVIATKGFDTLYDAEASALAAGRPHDENSMLSVERRARGRRRRPPPQAATRYSIIEKKKNQQAAAGRHTSGRRRRPPPQAAAGRRRLRPFMHYFLCTKGICES